MTRLGSCAYVGTVVHKRLVPRQHAFSYRVFALCLDVDEIDALHARLRLLSRNRWNLLSFHDRDHGAGDGAPAGQHVRGVLRQAGLEHAGARIRLLCYPRVLGYVFNPLSVYFGDDSSGRPGAIVYEVTNTFRERKSYVIPVGGRPSEVIAQHCAKEMYVSPFTAREASYGFHVVPPGDRVVVGVDVRDGGVPVLKTHFRGERRELTDIGIARLVARHPLMTLKVVGGIHLEAARLWLKGIPLVPRHSSPAYSFTVVRPAVQDTK